MADRVVVDAGPLIHLSQAGALSLLGAFEAVIVPRTVLDEVDDEVRAALSVIDHAVVEVADHDLQALDPGETAALVRAREDGATLLTDDLDAREAADELGVDVHGSIGVVLYGVRLGRLTTGEAVAVIRALQHDSSLYLTAPLVEYALDRLEGDDVDWA